VSDIWIVDSGTDSVYQYTGAASRTSGSQAAAASLALAAGNTNPQGIADPPAAGFVAGAGSRPNDSSVVRDVDFGSGYSTAHASQTRAVRRNLLDERIAINDRDAAFDDLVLRRMHNRVSSGTRDEPLVESAGWTQAAAVGLNDVTATHALETALGEF
jgi:hypothetical protein